MNFENEFYWGVASSAFQIEGAINSDGKGKSIWDEFSSRKGKIKNSHKANIASDFYNRYTDDIKLISSLNIPNYRFSISWSRIIPGGTGEINYKGIDFYNKVIDCCLSNNIEPWITLYHWDLPLTLEMKGGWTNRDIIHWFAEYVIVAIKYFGDRVKHWIVLNEPMVFTGAGYFLGIHAPGKVGIKNFLPAVHHAALCQAIGIRIIKSMLPTSHAGTTFSCTFLNANTNSEKDGLATKRVDALLNRLFIEPLLGMGYPFAELPFLRKIEKYVKENDEILIKEIPDFAGIQNYTRDVISHTSLIPYINAKIIPANKRNVNTTMMNWEIHPRSLYEMIMKFNKYKDLKEIIVTENGAAFTDVVVDGKVNDDKRKLFIEKCIEQLLRAKSENAKVNGYFLWSFTDNFEWSEGLTPRFGIVHIDYTTQKRTVKASGLWYSEFLRHISLKSKNFISQ